MPSNSTPLAPVAADELVAWFNATGAEGLAPDDASELAAWFSATGAQGFSTADRA